MRIFGQEFKRQIPGIDDVAPIDVGGMFPVLKGGCIMGWAFTVVYPGNLRQRLTPKLTRNPESLGYKSRDIILHSLINGNTKVTYYYSRSDTIDPMDAYHNASMVYSVLICAARGNKCHVA